MTVPKWLVPIISIVAALAVGVAMAFVGASLTRPAGDTAAPQPVKLQVAGALDASGKAVTTGSRFGAKTQTKSSGSALLDAATRLMEHGETPQAAAVALARHGLTRAPAANTGDACSPAHGSPAADCPSGVHGAIAADTAPPDLAIAGQAFPPTQAQYSAHGNALGPTWCPAVTPTETSVPIGISSTVPANVTYEYWPTAHPTATQSGEIDFTPAEQSTFEADLRANVAAASLPVDQHCVTLSGLAAYTPYTVLISAHDYLGRDATVSTFTFNPHGPVEIPSTAIGVLSANVVVAGVFSLPSQSTQVKLFVVPTGQNPDCNATVGEHIAAVYHESTSTPFELSQLDYDQRYTGRTDAGYIVPEGSNILVCARWFNAGSAHSWERSQPIKQVQQLFQSPNRILPEVTVESVTNAGSEFIPVRTISVSTHEGTECGQVDIGGRLGATLPAVACRAQQQEDANEAYDPVHQTFVSPSDTPGSDAVDADLEVTASTQRATGAPYSNSMEIIDASHGCFGDCAFPPDADYSIDFPSDPPGSTAGSAQFRVHWVQGNSDYLGAEWGVGTLQDSTPAATTTSVPQMDTDATFATQDIDLVNRTVTAGFTLSVDRAVDYTVTITDPRGAAACLRPGGVATISGHTSASLPITFSSLCVGSNYLAQVDLTDAAGHHSRWGHVDPTTWWSGAALNVPPYPAAIRYEWGATGPTQAALTDIRIAVGAVDLHATNGNGGSCVPDGNVVGHGTLHGGLSEQTMVTVTMRLTTSSSFTLASCPPTAAGLPTTVTMPVTLADLTRPEGAIISIPGLSNFHVHLWVTP